jgi:hypothetical protein
MAKIEIRTMVTITQTDGTESSFSEVSKESYQDNPRFWGQSTKNQASAVIRTLAKSIEHRFGTSPDY